MATYHKGGWRYIRKEVHRNPLTDKCGCSKSGKPANAEWQGRKGELSDQDCERWKEGNECWMFFRVNAAARSRTAFITILTLAWDSKADSQESSHFTLLFYRNGTKVKKGQAPFPGSNSHLAAEPGCIPAFQLSMYLSGSQPGQVCTFSFQASEMSGNIFACHTGEERELLLADSRDRTGVLLNTLQCALQPQKNHPATCQQSRGWKSPPKPITIQCTPHRLEID